MSVKLLSLVVLCLLVAKKGFSQDVDFQYAIGASYAVGIENNEMFGGVPAVTFTPRLNFGLSREMSVSLSANLSAGFNVEGNTASGSTSSYTFEAPVSIDLNFGHAALKKSRSSFGGFVGAGYAFSSMKHEYESAFGGEIVSSGKTTGTYVHVGGRLEIGDYSYGGSLYSIIGTNDAMIYGIRICMNFGL